MTAMMSENGSSSSVVAPQCESIDDFRNSVYSTVYSVVTVLGLSGNGFALVVLVRTYQQNSPFHVYMLNLAVSDLLCVSTLPLRVIYYANRGQWNLGDFLCRISSYALYVNLYCSIFFMAAMSVTRFLAIVFPVQNLRLATRCRARCCCAAIWLFVCASTSPFLIRGQHVDPRTNKTKCFEPPASGNQIDKLMMLNYFSLMVGFVLPFLVILLCYAGIIRVLLSRGSGGGVARRQSAAGAKAIRMIAIVTLTFLVSFLPYHVQRSLHISFLARGSGTSCAEKVAMQKSVVVTLCLAAANSCFDPLLYFFSGEEFRTRLSTMRRSSRTSSAPALPAARPGGAEEGAALQRSVSQEQEQLKA